LQQYIKNSLAINDYDVSMNLYTQRISITSKIGVFSLYFIKDILRDNPPLHDKDEKHKDFNEKISNVLHKKIGWMIGFRKPFYSGAITYMAEAMFNANSFDYLYFILNDFNNSQTQNILGLFSKSVISNNILAMIPATKNNITINNTDYNGIIEKKREYFGPVNIQKIKVQLLNQHGEYINLNNMDFSFSIDVEIGYDW
jgi:hypothetical protein